MSGAHLFRQGDAAHLHRPQVGTQGKLHEQGKPLDSLPLPSTQSNKEKIGEKASPEAAKEPKAGQSDKLTPIGDQIALWTMIATAITAVATMGQAYVTYMVATSISKASGLSESLQISREIDKLWQDYNREAIVNEDFRNTIRQIESLKEPPERTQLNHLIFYLLNIIYISWTAHTSKRDNFEHSQTIVRDHLALLYPKRDLVLAILTGNRGYNKTFVEACVEAFTRMDNTHATADTPSTTPNNIYNSPEPAPSLVSEGKPFSSIEEIKKPTPGEATMKNEGPDEHVEQLLSVQDSLIISSPQASNEVLPSSIVEQGSLNDGPNELVIRPARADEWKDIQALNVQIFEFELEHCEPTSNVEFPFTAQGEEYCKKAAQHQHNFSAIVADLSGIVVGYAIIKKIADLDLTHRVGVVQYQLSTLSVDKAHRDGGIGGKLVDAAKAYAAGQGANRLKVTAYAGNDRAEHLYQKKGFSKLETTFEVKL